MGGSGGSSTTLLLIADPGVPGKVTIVAGDNQSGAPGVTLPLALLARIEDNFGNALPNVPVVWTVDSGSATLVNSINRSDTQARVSSLVRLGNAPGAVKISVTAQGGLASAKTTFTANVIISATTINKISGDGQSTTVNTAFTDSLVAQVLDANGAGVPGVPVTFTVNSGSATLGSPTATSDSSGFIRTTVTAGSNAGPVTISASLSGNTVSWTLTVRPIGPTITTILNEASRQNLIAPGSVATIRGTNIAPTLRGYLLPSNDYGARPTTLGGVSVTFGGVAAPIFWVANVDGQESVTVQVPFEAGENTTVPVTVNSGGTSASQSVTISSVAPGIYETTDSQGRTYAVAARPDGSFVTPDNAAVRGETIRVFVTGLGRTTPAASTNSGGVAGQNVAGNVIVGVNDAGVQLVSAQYAQNLIGVYVVSFVVPSDTATGTARNLAVAVDAGGGNLTFSNGSNLAIR